MTTLVPAPARSIHHAPRGSRVVGLLVALGVALAITLVEVLLFRTRVTSVGVLVAAPLGALFGVRAATWYHPARTILGMAALAMLGGSLVIAWDLSLGAGTDAFLTVWVFGVALLGLPALILTTAATMVWAFTCRAIFPWAEGRQ